MNESHMTVVLPDRRSPPSGAFVVRSAQLARVVEQTADLVMITDRDGTIEYVNPAYERVTGFTKDEVVGLKPNIHKSGRHDPTFYADLWATILAGKPYKKEIINKKKDGSVYVSLKTITPLLDETGEITHFVSTDKDITERKRHELEILALNQELKRSNAELEQFANFASHDLQAPLRTIYMHLQLLEKKVRLDPQSAEYLTFATGAAKKLQELIQDLLALSRVGAETKARVPVSCDSVVEQVLAFLGEAISQSGAEIEHGPLPVIHADPTQISLLFQNILSNALKYRSESPKIRIEARREKEHWLFSIHDNGIGIAEDQIPKLFAMFRRLHSDSEYPGTGIGLAICKKIVESHGGRIWMESRSGEGTTVYFTLSRTLSHATEPRTDEHLIK